MESQPILRDRIRQKGTRTISSSKTPKAAPKNMKNKLTAASSRYFSFSKRRIRRSIKRSTIPLRKSTVKLAPKNNKKMMITHTTVAPGAAKTSKGAVNHRQRG